ncbi:MAG: hypothetical protein AB8E87_08580 [Prochlorococcus sp.]
MLVRPLDLQMNASSSGSARLPHHNQLRIPLKAMIAKRLGLRQEHFRFINGQEKLINCDQSLNHLLNQSRPASLRVIEALIPGLL